MNLGPYQTPNIDETPNIDKKERIVQRVQTNSINTER